MSPSQASETCASASSATSASGHVIMRTALEGVKNVKTEVNCGSQVPRDVAGCVPVIYDNVHSLICNQVSIRCIPLDLDVESDEFYPEH
jgi:hypothetical protein